MGFLSRNVNSIVLMAAIVLVICFTMVADNDHDYLAQPAKSFRNVARDASLLGIFALGAGIVVIAGGIDLSSGSVIAFCGSVCALVMMACAPTNEIGMPRVSEVGAGAVVLAIAVTLVVGLMIGTLHAWLVTAVRLPPFVATLASLVGLRSLGKVFNPAVSSMLGSRQTTIRADSAAFEALSHWWVPLAVFLVLSLACYILMSHTIWGRHIYAMGGNEEAARLSGIRIDRMKWLAYCIGSLTAAIASVLYVATVSTADPAKLGIAYELNAIAAAVVGGCSLTGGLGTIPGIMLGVLFLRVVIDSINKVVEQGSDDFEGLIVGFLVVAAVAIHELGRQMITRQWSLFAGPLGIAVIPILGFLTGVIVFVLSGTTAGYITFGSVTILLSAWKVFEAKLSK